MPAGASRQSPIMASPSDPPTDPPRSAAGEACLERRGVRGCEKSSRGVGFDKSEPRLKYGMSSMTSNSTLNPEGVMK
eukprot:2867313-Heterocapsa_arctica.AAC.1